MLQGQWYFGYSSLLHVIPVRVPWKPQFLHLLLKVPEIQVLRWIGVKIRIHFSQGTFDLNPLCVPEERVGVGIGQESEDKQGVGQDWSRQNSP